MMPIALVRRWPAAKILPGLILAGMFSPLCAQEPSAAPATNAAPAANAVISNALGPNAAPALPPMSAPLREGIAAERSRNFEAAIDDFTQAIQLDGTDERAYKWRGFTYRQMGNRAQALADFSQAIQLNPKDSRAYSQRGFTYRLLGENDQAIADFTQAVVLDPGNAYAFNHRGNIYHERAQYDKALGDYISAIQANPRYGGAYNNLAWLLATCPSADFRNGKKAVAYASKACDLAQWKNVNFLDTLAAACAEAGDFAAAVKWENQVAATPGRSQADVAEAQHRIAMYQAHQPFRKGLAPATPEASGLNP